MKEEMLDKLYNVCTEIGIGTIMELLEGEEEEKEYTEMSDEFKSGYHFALTMIERIDCVIAERNGDL